MQIDPIAQNLIDDSRASGRPNAHLLPIATARQNFEDTFGALAKPEVFRTIEVRIPTRDGDAIRGRLYLPVEETALPLTVYFHGGGWLLGSIDSHDVATRMLANASRSAVLSVDYRRGPDFLFPTAVNDAIDALEWATGPASGLPIDRDRVAVAGDSAGGNLAGALALHARESGPRLEHQLLVYPVTTCDINVGFDAQYEGVMIYRDEVQWHQDNYLPSPGHATDPRVSILDADHTGLPDTTIILAGCDPIAPQGRLYAEALRAKGVKVAVHESPSMIHGFFGLDELLPAASAAMKFAGARLSSALTSRVAQ